MRTYIQRTEERNKNMLILPDKQFNKVSNAIAFIDFYLNAPDLIDADNTFRAIKGNRVIKTCEAVRILREVVNQFADEHTRDIVLSEMERREFYNYIDMILQENR